jgi:hypothetical protein
MHGFRVSWVESLAVGKGGYVAGLVFVGAQPLLGLNGLVLNALARLGVVGLPAGAIGLWLV